MKKLVLILIMATSYNLAYSKGGGKGHMKEVLEELDLSSEQLAKFKEFRQANKKTREERKAQREEMKNARESVKTGFINNISDDELLKLHNKVVELKNKRELGKFEKMKAMKNILTESQREKFMELQESKRKRGPKRD
ncbi:MAG: Spy/CpxP family protein refolding chaperone [Bacteriovoracaceae bacterium]|nr:Spy/CpxP family protein refolding chaperone [Bacteriovoracaceae bacterium]